MPSHIITTLSIANAFQDTDKRGYTITLHHETSPVVTIASRHITGLDITVMRHAFAKHYFTAPRLTEALQRMAVHFYANATHDLILPYHYSSKQYHTSPFHAISFLFTHHFTIALRYFTLLFRCVPLHNGTSP